mgnify:CR=1 FL=1
MFVDNKKIILTSFFGLVFFILDRFLKILAVSGKIKFIANENMALGFGGKISNLFFYIMVGILLILVVFFTLKFFRQKKYWLTTGWFYIFLGAISNLIDRFVYSSVIDYINFYLFRNNIADILIWVGILMIVFYNFENKK